MATYQAAVDIANRALQLLGASRITALTDDSKNAAAMAFVYDKLRQVELRRAVWKFSVRKAVLRAVTSTTKLLSAPTWAAGDFTAGDIVTYGGQLWLASADTSATPGTAGSAWVIYAGPTTVSEYDADTAYGVGELVYEGATVYLSLTSDNDDDPPTANWHAVTGATASALVVLEPQEVGGRFLFRLPSGFLRYAPDPKRGAFSVLGGPAGNAYLEQNFEGQNLVSSDPAPLVLRFAADVADVSAMDPMFCEGLALRLALATCEELTQSATKLSTIAQQYRQFMGDARTVNAIEVGPMEPDEDDWISVRR